MRKREGRCWRIEGRERRKGEVEEKGNVRKREGRCLRMEKGGKGRKKRKGM